MNTLKTMVLMVGLTLILIWAGGALGGRSGMTMALMFALMMNLFAYWFSDKIVLKMYRALEVREHEAPELYSIVRRLAQKAEIPMPKVYIINQDQPNAFATGRNPGHAAVAVTTGIMRILSREELEGVIAHELSHVKHRDILIGTIAATVAGATRYLAGALKKLDMTSRQIPMDAQPATAHMFIVNPLSGGGLLKLFSTHPPVAERVKRLEERARGRKTKHKKLQF